MGKFFDIAFFSGASFLVTFVVLSFTEKDIRLIGVLAAISAFCVGVIINVLFQKVKKTPHKKRGASSDKKVKALIYLEESEALNIVYELLSKKYRLREPLQDAGCLLFKEGVKEIHFALVVLRKLKPSPDDLLSAWREIRKKHSAERIIFALPGKSDPELKLMTVKLTNPDIQILDKNRLKKLVRKYDILLPATVSTKKVRFCLRIKMYINRKRALRYSACALLLTLNFILFGQVLYLIFASVLSFFSVFSFLSEKESAFLSD